MPKTAAKAQRFFGLLALGLVAGLLLIGPAQAQTDEGISTTQTAEPDPATVGQPLTFTITATNNSSPQHVGVNNFLPEGTELISAMPSRGRCIMSHHDSNDVECPLGEIPRGGSATVEVVATPTAPGTVRNTAVVGGGSTPAERHPITVTVNQLPDTGGMKLS